MTGSTALATIKAKSAEVTDERRSARSTVLVAAMIEFDEVRVPVRVINLSAHGALVQGDVMPGADSEVAFRCNGMVTPGWVAWVRAPLAGINFDAPIEPRISGQSAGTGAMVIKDNRQLDFRRPGFRGNQMTEEEREIVAKWLRGQQDSDED